MSLNLNNISSLNNKKKKRLGRGIGSGTGKTCARGVKGQKSRSGVAIKSFEGGQTSICQRMPKVGFNSRKSKNYTVINLSKIAASLSKNSIKEKIITKELLVKCGLIKSNNEFVKIIAGKKDVKLDVKITADAFSSNVEGFINKESAKS